jgi:hypothetical protein
MKNRVIEIVIFQVGSQYAWVLRQAVDGNGGQTVREGACSTFRAAAVEAETALLLHERKETK